MNSFRREGVQETASPWKRVAATRLGLAVTVLATLGAPAFADAQTCTGTAE